MLDWGGAQRWLLSDEPVEKIRAAAKAGIRLFGENYVQEVKAKQEALEESVEWHMIGHLQRNKSKLAVSLFSLIESLDSIELAAVLDKEGKKLGKQVRAFVEVNLAKEETKNLIDSFMEMTETYKRSRT